MLHWPEANRLALSRCFRTGISLLSFFAAVSAVGASLEWTAQPGYRSAPVKPGETGKVGFVTLDAQRTGVDFTNVVAFERHSANQILLNGSGVAAGDVDGDGWCDLFFCGLGGRSALYRNLGDWKFRNVTAESGMAMGTWTWLSTPSAKVRFAFSMMVMVASRRDRC